MKPEKELDFEIHPLIKERWSSRAFSDKDVDDETLFRLFEAARWAPSSRNAQPWRFIVTRMGTPAFQKLSSFLRHSNAEWAPNAPVLIFTVAKTTDQRGNPNSYAFHDTGQAVAYLTFQAVDLGLNLHQMAGFEHEQAKEAFQLPEHHEPVTVIALGYRGNEERLSEVLQEREGHPQDRHPISQFVYSENWGNSIEI